MFRSTKQSKDTQSHTGKHTTVWSKPMHSMPMPSGCVAVVASVVAVVVYLCLCRYARCSAHCFTRSTKLNSLERAVGCVWLIITNEMQHSLRRC